MSFFFLNRKIFQNNFFIIESLQIHYYIIIFFIYIFFLKIYKMIKKTKLFFRQACIILNSNKWFYLKLENDDKK